MEGMRARCPTLAEDLARAEGEFRRAGGNNGRQLDWDRWLGGPSLKLQGSWSRELSSARREALLQAMTEEDAADARSHGGPGAGSFLLPTADGVQVMPDTHFLVALRDRLLLPVCPHGALCQHRRRDGRLCGAVLDGRGHHAKKCSVGGALLARHDRLKDWQADAYTDCTGMPCEKEQHVPQWDKVELDAETGEQLVEQAILDVATADNQTGAPLYCDITIKCAFSDDPALLRARARRDGRAAGDAAAEKRRRYAEAGAALVPMAFEDGGRPSEEAAAFIRKCGAAKRESEEPGACATTARLWQECSTLLQLGNAEMILAANGR